eukprot:TRINITY_DN287_c0_g1_i1.p1 TRINITY_DN287_c0_g1~~TRINITY_DN287_c0_g1_i1.p1  ORF type:complete len:781 (+),score=164.92 TRINITY_DN287_c0_g1_i1:61-2403(+)
MPQQGQLDWQWNWSTPSADTSAAQSPWSAFPSAPVHSSAPSHQPSHAESHYPQQRKASYEARPSDDDVEIHSLLSEAASKPEQLLERSSSAPPIRDTGDAALFAYSTAVSSEASMGSDSSVSKYGGYGVYSSSHETPQRRLEQESSPWAVEDQSHSSDAALFSAVNERLAGLSLQIEKEEDFSFSNTQIESLIGSTIFANTPPSQSRYVSSQEQPKPFEQSTPYSGRYQEIMQPASEPYGNGERGQMQGPSSYTNPTYYDHDKPADNLYGYSGPMQGGYEYAGPTPSAPVAPQTAYNPNFGNREMDSSHSYGPAYYYGNMMPHGVHPQPVVNKRHGYPVEPAYPQRPQYQQMENYLHYGQNPAMHPHGGIPNTHPMHMNQMYSMQGDAELPPYGRPGQHQNDRNRKPGNRQGNNRSQVPMQGPPPPVPQAVLAKAPKQKAQPQIPQKPAPVDQTPGSIYSMCKDQHGCRYLQKQLEHGQPNVTDSIFAEVYEHAIELMTDPFGNYLCQKLLEHCSAEQRSMMIQRVSNRLVHISLNMHGTRAVQKIIDMSTVPPLVHFVIESLKGSVVDLIKDLNGNHVIQRCLQRFAPEFNQFIYDSVAEKCVEVSTHRHGCCVFQRCIDHANEGQKMQLVREVVANSIVLIQDPYGNYVVQYIADLQIDHVNNTLCMSFLDKIFELSAQKFSSNVIEKCLRLSKGEPRSAMVRQLAKPEGILLLLQDPFANYVVQTALSVAEREDYVILAESIQPHLAALRNTPYGKRILNKLRDSPHAIQGQILPDN